MAVMTRKMAVDGGGEEDMQAWRRLLINADYCLLCW